MNNALIINDPALNPHWRQGHPDNKKFSTALLILSVALAILSCLPSFRAIGSLTTRSLSLCGAVTGNIDRFKQGNFLNRVTVISKVGAVALGILGVTNTLPILITASFAANIFSQILEMGLHIDSPQGLFHGAILATSILQLLISLFPSVIPLAIGFYIVTTLINGTAMVALGIYCVVDQRRYTVGISCILLGILPLHAPILAWLSGGTPETDSYKFKLNDRCFGNGRDEVKWTFYQKDSSDGRDNYFGEHTLSGVAHKNDLIEFDLPHSGYTGQLVVEGDNFHYITNTLAREITYINGPDPQLVVAQYITNSPIIPGPVLAVEHLLPNNNRVLQTSFREEQFIESHQLDAPTESAIAKLYQMTPLSDETMYHYVTEFMRYLETVTEARLKERAKRALEGNQLYANDFGPFLPSDTKLLACLWWYCNTFPEKERELARMDIVHGLSRCFNRDGSRICRPGQRTRLVISVLQGRMDGVMLDKLELTNAEKTVYFQQIARPLVQDFFCN